MKQMHDILISFAEFIQAKFMLTAVIISGVLTPVYNYIEKYIFDDWDAAQYILWMVVVDTLFGIIKHWRNHSLSFLGFLKSFVKFAVCIGVMVTCKGLASVGTEFESTGHYIEYFGKLSSIIYVGLSALKNIYYVSNGLLPIGWLIDRLETAGKKLNEPDKKPIDQPK